MKSLSERVQGVRTFLGEVGTEMRKSTWPERQELIESTIVVITSVALLAVFVGVSDKILVEILTFIMPSG